MPPRPARSSLLVTVAVLVAVIGGASTARAEELGDPTAPVASHRMGLDVSWPQCDRVLPEATSFAVVGVNGGTAASTNPCLADQL